jgi:hypothetical protein
LLPSYLGFVYFHVKGMKRDRGMEVYQLEKNPHSIFNRLKLDPRWTNPELMTFEEYCRMEPAARTLPNPEDLSIWPIRNQRRLKALGER